MPLTNSGLKYYDHNVLRLKHETRTTYTAQVNRLISKLTEKIHEHTNLSVAKVVKAGSFAKHTILRKGEGRSVDVDVAFYLKGADPNSSVSGFNPDTQTFESVSQQIYDLLISLYPTKELGDFEIQKRAATVTFVGTGLDVDVVPIIEDPLNPTCGWQFGTDGSKVKTDVPGQLKFMKDRKDADALFRSLVRLIKQWRNHREVPGLKGYSIELITAYVLDRDGIGDSLEDRFCKVLLYIAQTGLNDTLSFPENTKPLGVFNDPVRIIDPVNSQNNVGSRITESEKQEIIATALTSWETAHYASVENKTVLWKEIFGPRFKVWDSMSATVAATTTYSVTDIENVMRNFGADLHMIAQSSNTRTRRDVDDLIHDITLMAKEECIDFVDVTLLSNGQEVRAVKYVINEDSSTLTSTRPGGVLWPSILGASLRIIVGGNSKWHSNPIATNRLYKTWGSTDVGTSHSQLATSSGRNFVSNGYGLERKDYQ